MNKELILVLGNVGVGKTTECKKYAQLGHRIISCDTLRYMLGGGEYIFDEQLEEFIMDATYTFVELLLQGGHSVVIDETWITITKENRKRYIELGTRYGYDVLLLEFPKMPREEAVSRRMMKNHGELPKERWEDVYNMFDSMYEIANVSEGFTEIVYPS